MNTYTAGWLATPFDDIKNGDQETSVYFSIPCKSHYRGEELQNIFNRLLSIFSNALLYKNFQKNISTFFSSVIPPNH